MCWTRTWVINGLPVKAFRVGGFDIGFNLYDEDMRQLIIEKDPRILDALAQAAQDMQDIEDAGDIEGEMIFEFDYIRRGPSFDLDDYVDALRHILTDNKYISEDGKNIAQYHLREALQAKKVQATKKAKKRISKRRRTQFNAKRDQLLLVLIDRDSYVCQECGKIEGLEIDHIVPLSRGGSDELDNLQLLCHACNMAKKDKMPEVVNA